MQTSWKTWTTIAGLLAFAAVSCSDDKPANAEKTAGGESTYQKVKRRADAAHSNFKEEVKPAATWVDDKSQRAADELRKGVGADPDEPAPPKKEE